MTQGSHLLIAGATGSGKSVLINSIMYSLLTKAPDEARFVLIDPKRVELIQYAELPHTIAYITEAERTLKMLDNCIDCMERRYKEMQKQRVKDYNGCHIYIIIDELADLMTTCQRRLLPKLQRIAQLGRAAKIHLICATQCPNRKIIPAELTLNFTDKVALRCDSAIESRQIIGIKGAELLPRYGQAWYKSPMGVIMIPIPMTDESELQARVNFWM